VCPLLAAGGSRREPTRRHRFRVVVAVAGRHRGWDRLRAGDLSVGGLAGLIALIIGGAVVGRSSNKVVEAMERVAKTTDAGQKATLMITAKELTQKMTTFGTVVLLCRVVASILMAIAHYIWSRWGTAAPWFGGRWGIPDLPVLS
jgi:hypothetical protein